MSCRTESFAFNLYDKVTLIDINRPGTVTGLCVDREGIIYRVAFWHESQRRAEWVTENEIRLAEVANG